MASFMEQVRGGKAKFNPDRVVLTAGATAANELLTFILANPGDALLVPTPYYPGFDRDIRWRTGVQIVPINCESFKQFSNNSRSLRRSYDRADSMNTTYEESSFMLTLLIPGPKSPGKDIDVYLRPLIDDLKDLWAKPGVETIDVATCLKFNTRAMVL
ncbi:1-aminocyclopropane-1-carboxylate synthase 7-like protein [Tanacetum coccineum]